jgi:hypothetical protein
MIADLLTDDQDLVQEEVRVNFLHGVRIKTVPTAAFILAAKTWRPPLEKNTYGVRKCPRFS